MNPLFNICSEFLIERIIMADTRKKVYVTGSDRYKALHNEKVYGGSLC